MFSDQRLRQVIRASVTRPAHVFRMTSFWIFVLAASIMLGAALGAEQPSLPAWQGILHNAAGAPVAGAQIRLSGDHESADAKTGAERAIPSQAAPSRAIQADHRRRRPHHRVRAARQSTAGRPR